MECLCLLCCGAACLVWGCQRCCCARSHKASDGPAWREATEEEFRDVPRVCRVVLAVYEKDLANPAYADRLAVDHVVKRADYKDTGGNCPPYLIYVDHEARDICFAVRGLNMANPADFRVLMDQRKGEQFFDGGYVHSGLLHSARWALEKEYDVLNGLAQEYPEYSVTFAGHSLGSGIVAMMTVLVRRLEEATAITPDRLRCYGIAPARSTSLNLAVRYADSINSIILQDDFLPRTSAPIQSILGASFCMPCFLCFKCCTDLFLSKERKLKDRRRLYPPGRLYHILYTEDFRCKCTVPVVKTGVPVEHRFEGVIFSRTMVNDHSIVHIEKKAVAAVEAMQERDVEEGALQPPKVITMERMSSTLRLERAEEVAASLAKCQSMGVPNAKSPAELDGQLKALAALVQKEKSSRHGLAHPRGDADESAKSSMGTSTVFNSSRTVGDPNQSTKSSMGMSEHLGQRKMDDSGQFLLDTLGENAEEQGAGSGSRGDSQGGNGSQGDSQGVSQGDSQVGGGSQGDLGISPAGFSNQENSETTAADGGGSQVSNGATGSGHLGNRGATAAERWKDAYHRVQQSSDQAADSRWERLISALMEGQEDADNIQPKVELKFLRLPSMPLARVP